ncbi:MAG: MerR family transcriptional regulator [Actinomycetota bacterium]|nr:MerR family transcriptional regulator [Actinomycetota bacterium]
MRTGEVAAAAGVTIKALRYYERQGLLQPVRLANGYRDYSAEDVRLVGEIRALISLGMAPKEAAPFLECLREGHEAGDDCPQALAAYQDKINQLDAVIMRLRRDRDRLEHQMREATRRGFRSLVPGAEEAEAILPHADPLPDGLSVPEDDGLAVHLPERVLPPLAFTGTDGVEVRLDSVTRGRWVLFLYPLTGDPAVDVPRGWDEIPGARGCSQEACGFRDNLAALQERGAECVLGLSSDAAEYQEDLVRRLRLPYPLLSDPELRLAAALHLPTFEVGGTMLYKRLTMIVEGDRIKHVFYPIFPPDAHAAEVLEWLAASRASTG